MFSEGTANLEAYCLLVKLKGIAGFCFLAYYFISKSYPIVYYTTHIWGEQV